MNFASDNWSGAAPEINRSLAAFSEGYAVAYGDSDHDQRVYDRFNAVFEKECHVFFTGTGTAANSLAFAACMKPGGVAFCHTEAHAVANEGGAPQFLTSGGRICGVGGGLSRIDPERLSRAVDAYPPHFNHLGQGVMISITQTTEGGTCYGLDDIERIGAIAGQAGLPLHMDGARFANALVELDCSAAEMTWKRGIDMVSFGGTKNGCWCAEALVIFNPDLADQVGFIRKRMGHLFSKSRFIAAQFDAYFADDLWLSLARHSNGVAVHLRDMIRSSNHARLAWESNTNQVFIIAEKERAERWMEAGARFIPFPAPKDLEIAPGESEQVYRLVTSFASGEEDVLALQKVMQL